MSIAIMQPYFFPYIGYFQLLNAVDTFVIADDVNYIKSGYINRNSILMNNMSFKITLNLNAASQNKRINEIERGDNVKKLVETIRRSYSKAPFFGITFPLIEEILLNSETSLSLYLGNSIKEISKHLGLVTKVIYASDIDNKDRLRFDERIIDICKKSGEDHYVNAIGGRELYNKEMFSNRDIMLNFLRSKEMNYQQFGKEFVSNLSIIDVLMFNSISDVRKMLTYYDLV